MFVEAKFFHKAGEGSGGGGGGGRDSHNKRSFLTPEALRTAYPTAEPGDFAIVESTDTVWVWDSDGSQWKDADQKGQVTSVNNQTGAVTLTASDVGALPSNTHIPADPVQADWGEADSTALDYIKNKPTLGTAASANTTDFATAAQGAKADTAVQPGDLATVATTGAYSDLTGTPTIPAAQVNSDWNASSGVAEILNKPTLGTMASESASDYTKTSGLATVATTGSYSDLSNAPTIPTVGDGTITITQGGVTKGTFTTNQNGNTTIDVDAGGGGGLPSQTGNAGKFLTTDGTDASWSDKPLVNTATSSGSLGIKGDALFQRTTTVGVSAVARNDDSVAIGNSALSYAAYNVVIGSGAQTSSSSTSSVRGDIAIGGGAKSTNGYGIAIGMAAKSQAFGAVQIGPGTNTTAATACIAIKPDANSSSVNYRLLDSDGTIPTDRFTTTPSADGAYVPTLTISSGVATRSWAAPGGGGSTALSLTLAAANWSNNSITVTATGVTTSNNVIVSPAPASQSAYTTAGVMCTAQASDSLTFTCTTTPSSDLTVTVLII